MRNSNRNPRKLSRKRGNARGSSLSHTFGASSASLVGTLDLGTMATNGSAIPNFVPSTSQYQELDLAQLADRVARVAGAFSRWRLLRFRLRFVSQVSSATAGQLAFGFVDDPTFATTSTTPTYAQVVAMRGSVENSVWKNSSLDIVPKMSAPWLYTTISASTSSLQRQQQAGVLFVAGLGLANTTTYGEMVLDYHCAFAGESPVETPSLRVKNDEKKSLEQQSQLASSGTSQVPSAAASANIVRMSVTPPVTGMNNSWFGRP